MCCVLAVFEVCLIELRPLDIFCHSVRKLLQVVEQISLLNKVLPKVFLISFIALFRKFPFSRFSLKQGLDRMILSVLFNGTFVNKEVIIDDVKM